jgi:hypothetical protein
MGQDRNRLQRFVYALAITMFVAVPLVAASCGRGSSKSKTPTGGTRVPLPHPSVLPPKQ